MCTSPSATAVTQTLSSTSASPPLLSALPSAAPSRHAWDGDNDGGGGSSPPPLRRRQTRRRGASSCRSLPWPSRPHALQPHVRQERVEPATGGLSAQTDGRAHACFRAGKRSVLQKPRMRVLHGPSFLFFYARFGIFFVDFLQESNNLVKQLLSFGPSNPLQQHTHTAQTMVRARARLRLRLRLRRS